MTYSISEVSKRIGISIYTLRYYDKEGLMPYVDRTKSGTRVFKDSDFPWLEIINCLKQSGVPIKKIKEFVDWCMAGDSTIEQRFKFIKNHKKDIEKQIANLQEHLRVIDHKVWYYETASKAGTTAIHDKEIKSQSVS